VGYTVFKAGEWIKCGSHLIADYHEPPVKVGMIFTWSFIVCLLAHIYPVAVAQLQSYCSITL